jgi:hypothetical protein
MSGASAPILLAYSYATGIIMNKLLTILIGSLLAVSAQAQVNSQAQAKPQPREQAGSSANSAPIGQAVSGNNTTARMAPPASRPRA